MKLLTRPLASLVGLMEVVIVLRKGRETSIKSSKEPIVEDVRNSQRTGRSKIQGGEVASSGVM